MQCLRFVIFSLYRQFVIFSDFLIKTTIYVIETGTYIVAFVTGRLLLKTTRFTKEVFFILTSIFSRKCKTDDTGKIYSGDGELEPNCEYTLNGNKYKTDAQGRIINAKGDVKLPTEDRKNLPDMDNPDKRDTDDKGHVIGHQIGGADTEGNLVPQDATFNRGEYNKLEQELAKLKAEGHDVKIDVKLVYEGDSKRPSKFIVKYTVDGKTYVKTFINEADQTGGQNG